MIDSEKRSMLTDALTPPPGYTFSSGVATTFSLDLITLLTLPLHLAWLSSGQETSDQVDPLRIMEALRRTSEKLTVVYQHGRMQIPHTASPLVGLLEGMVHGASAKHGGAFHPKVWLLKFSPTDKISETRMRLIVLSRNITDDGSWDLSMQLDGICRPNLQNKNNIPLRDFISKSIELSKKVVTKQRQTEIDQISTNLMRCEWELPNGFDEVQFHVLGLDNKPATWLPHTKSGKWDELGVISPFVTERALESLSKLTNTPLFLIARPEELDRLNEPLPGKFNEVFTLADGAEISDDEDDQPSRERGLHAKVFVGRSGWNTHLFIGSANATNAALIDGINVEFMAELIGKYSKIGKPESWLGSDGIRCLLTPYIRSIPDESDEKLHNQNRLEELRKALVDAELLLDCVAVDVGWTVSLKGLRQIDFDDVKVAVWPLSLKIERAVPFSSENESSLILGVLSKQDITSLTGFRLRIGQEELQFGLDIPLKNAPQGRELEIFRNALQNRDGFIRYLMLFLGDWDTVNTGPEWDDKKNGLPWRISGELSDGPPLFEMLARAFVSDPNRLKQISQVVSRLKQESENGEDDLIPSGFLELWSIFENAMMKKVS
jgi:hypothetical protein